MASYNHSGICTVRNRLLLLVITAFFTAGCNNENPAGTSSVEIISPITTLPGNKAFVRGQNEWLHDTGFSHLSLTESYKKWTTLKNSHGNTYVYYTSSGSWTGYGESFEILIRHDSIARIERTVYQYDQPPGHKDTISHGETATDSAAYYGIMNFDDLYTYAQDVVLTKDPTQNTIYREMFENGLLSSCKFRPNGCVDDCLFGVSIDSLFFGDIVEK